MARELRYIDDPGLTVTATVITISNGDGTIVSLTEDAETAGYYVGNFPSLSAGTYDIAYRAGGAVTAVQTVAWNGTQAATDEEFLETLNAIQGRLNSIGSGRVTVVAPVVDPARIELISGDDYLEVDGRAITLTFDGAPNLVGATVTLIAHARCCDCRNADFELTRIGDSGDSAAFELTAEETSALCLADYAYDFAVKATLANASVVTLAEGSIAVHETVEDDE